MIDLFDRTIVAWFKKVEVPLARFALFIVYFWFGLLKLVGVSPAEPLVEALFNKTLVFLPFGAFYVSFAVFEMAIGVLFLVRGWERIALVLLGLHVVTTALPLMFLSELTWQGWFTPTLEGQYIIKNILIIAAAVVVGSRLVPRSPSRPIPGSGLA